ncbi:hypothetical protein BBP40_005427 [Aspergillus hancockii]|nr:hypothetical protein BBP40_005427 [Aspergillus hancockii]
MINRLAKWLDKCIPADYESRAIGYLASSDIRHLAITFAAVKVRAKVVLLSPRNSAAIHSHVMQETNCSFLIFDNPFHELANELIRDAQVRTCAIPTLLECLRYGDTEENYPYQETWATAADDIFAILHTSGSTGMPKPIEIPHSFIAAIDAQHLVSSRVGRKCQLEILAEADLPFMGFPLFHIAGLGLSCFLILSGCTLVLGTPSKPVSRQMVRDVLKTSGIDAALLPPSVLDDVAQDEQLVQELSRCCIGAGAGESLSKKVRLINSFGSSECGSFIQFPIKSKHWDGYQFSDGLNGIEWQRTDTQSDDFEMVIVRSNSASEFQGVFKIFPHLEQFETRDLFSRHETAADCWVYRGRRDDIVVLSTGENLNPLSIEGAICTHPGIQGALVFGSSYPAPGCLIELANAEEDRMEDIKQQVMETLDDAYRTSPDFAQIPAKNIMFANSDKPFIRTDKGTVQRKKTIQVYQADIDRLYKSSKGGFDSHGISIDLSSEEALAVSLVGYIARLMGADSLDSSSDFFRAGMSSQQVEILAATVREAIRNWPDCALDENQLNEDAIYSETCATRLANYIFHQCNSPPNADSDDRLEVMSATLEKYTASLPRGKNSDERQLESSKHIILVGSTGFVGSHLLRALSRRSRTKKITCIDRKNPGRAQPKATEEPGRSSGSVEMQYLTGDLQAQNLGLEKQTYFELTESVTTILHCQWLVDFNQPLSGFDSQIQGLVNLVKFAVASERQPRIIFLSSIAAVSSWDKDYPVPETLLSSLNYARTGYGESKLIASLLLHKAGELAGVRGSICRLGQIAGPVNTDGAWPLRDWFPLLLQSSKAIGYLPKTLGAQEHLDWIPVDILAELLADLTDTEEKNEEETTSYYHFVNPNRVTWESISRTVKAELQGKCRMITLPEWIRKLEDHAVRAANSNQQPPPGAKLIDFYKSLEAKPLELETHSTQLRIPRLSKVQPVNEEWMRTWFREWASLEIT